MVGKEPTPPALSQSARYIDVLALVQLGCIWLSVSTRVAMTLHSVWNRLHSANRSLHYAVDIVGDQHRNTTVAARNPNTLDQRQQLFYILQLWAKPLLGDNKTNRMLYTSDAASVQLSERGIDSTAAADAAVQSVRSNMRTNEQTREKVEVAFRACAN
jgi:hypothetical protein